VIDIGGQDMKCLGLRDGLVTRVFLNEACSAGCGSFLQSFAESLGLSAEEFALMAENALMPVDLGSRCTVFMNSRVRQAQKEGACVGDISAGLVYSVVRNALYKVLKLKSPDEMGEKVVVQGGTFKNDALLRAFELTVGREVTRPDIPELMGAFGAALLARDGRITESRLLGEDAVRAMVPRTSAERCRGCGNSCLLTRMDFGVGRTHVSGNRCPKGVELAAGSSAKKRPLPPNVWEQKYSRLFDSYKPRAEAARGSVGIPRALNMYEDYPFWFTFFTELGFRVELSAGSPDESLGMDSVPSQTLCYPAKLVHRHIADLLKRGVRRIFYPVLPSGVHEFPTAPQNFNCPVVTGYPDVALLNIDGLREAVFLSPTLPFGPVRSGRTARTLSTLLSRLGDAGEISEREAGAALEKAEKERDAYRTDVARLGDEALAYLEANGGVGIVLAGHPYHLDPEVHHGIPGLIAGYGATVFTEDSICHRAAEIGEPLLYAVDQWTYHSRLYRAASVVARHPDFAGVQMVQLNSFGCGLDAVSADQCAELLERAGKPHTLIKIDEGRNNGAARIRIRSLLARVGGSVRSRGSAPNPARGARPLENPALQPRAAGKRSLRVVLCPPLSPHHFQFLPAAMRGSGVDFRVLPEGGRAEVELGLKYVNNDMCYPAFMVVGQFLRALRSGEYDLGATDCLYVQTGGMCRASNYAPLLRRALDAAGFGRVGLLSVNAQGDAGGIKNFPVTTRALWKCLLALLYGDLLMRLLYGTRPRETERGSAERLYSAWAARCAENVEKGKWRVFREHARRMTADFAALPVDPSPRPRVGIVGEILVKFHGGANEHVVDLIEREGGEAVVPDLTNFLLYCLCDTPREGLGGLLSGLLKRLGVSFLERMRAPLREALEGTRFGTIHDIRDMADQAARLVSPANQAGEGWLLAAEMMRIFEDGVRNILCVQPFACLPNHITGKGIVKELKRLYEGVNILALDYDSSVSNVNQLNRIKLLMATARA
jgi:predicted nucleotide-binding protein (sugar kinase/HSP70/actin superfamily)